MSVTPMLFKSCRILFITIMCLNYLSCESMHHIKKYIKVNKIQGKVVNGITVPIEKYPFAVQFLNKGRFCGGVIIHSWAITTSAHCIEFNPNIQDMSIYTGAKYTYDFNSNKYNVLKFVMHEDYNKNQAFACDIAIVFSEKPIQFGDRAQKAILVNSDKWMDEREDNFTITGWGYTKENGEVSKVGLQMARLRYVVHQECSKLHNDYELSKDMFCLYGEGERDVCQGDSGGAVLWNDMLVGLTSHGIGCSRVNKPSIYTNVWFLRDWIEKQILQFSEDYCTNKSKTKDLFLNKIISDSSLIFK